MTRRNVVLPQPEGPMNETNSPRSMVEVDVLEGNDVAVAVVEGEAKVFGLDTTLKLRPRSPACRCAATLRGAVMSFHWRQRPVDRALASRGHELAVALARRRACLADRDMATRQNEAGQAGRPRNLRRRCSRWPTAGFAAGMVFFRLGSQTMRSASAPTSTAPFLRVDVEDLGDVGRGHGDELVHGQPAGIDAMGPEHGQAVFEAAGAVGDLARNCRCHCASAPW